jgi:hypothetical protein
MVYLLRALVNTIRRWHRKIRDCICKEDHPFQTEQAVEHQ